MFAKTRFYLIALVCALALFATACGGSDTSVSTDAGTADEGAADEGDAAAPTTAPSSDSSNATESPLGDLLGIPFGDDEAANQYFDDLSRQAEIKIAECMIGQGFEYQVVDYSQLDGATNVVDFETREFAEEYGFGIASNPFEESFEAFESFEDPNQVFIESLGEGEREAYQLALSGEIPDFDSVDFQTFEPGGCQGEAYSDLFAFGQVFDEFGDEFEEIEQAYEADPRIVEATSGWSSCMNEAGYQFADLASAEDDVERRYSAITQDPDAFVSIEDQMADLEEGDDTDFIFGPQTLNPAFQAQVDELAVDERAIALASWDCNGPLREIEDDVRVEYEQRFVDENGAAISEALGN